MHSSARARASTSAFSDEIVRAAATADAAACAFQAEGAGAREEGGMLASDIGSSSSRSNSSRSSGSSSSSSNDVSSSDNSSSSSSSGGDLINNNSHATAWKSARQAAVAMAIDEAEEERGKGWGRGWGVAPGRGRMSQDVAEEKSSARGVFGTEAEEKSMLEKENDPRFSRAAPHELSTLAVNAMVVGPPSAKGATRFLSSRGAGFCCCCFLRGAVLNRDLRYTQKTLTRYNFLFFTDNIWSYLLLYGPPQ